MNIDISRVNLLERDIEDWLYKNPADLPPSYTGGKVKKWIGRQYTLPSGIADLIGVRESGMVVVVEVKNVPINKAAVLQVCRYQNDLKYILSERMDYPHLMDGNEPAVEMVLIGPSIDGQTFTEARAVDVTVYQFGVSFTLEIDSLSMSNAHWSNVRDQHREIAARSEWEIFGLTNAEDYAQFKRERAQQEEQKIDDAFEEIKEAAAQVANETPEYFGDQRLVDVLAAECPYPPDATDVEWQVADDGDPNAEE